jgi:hypothetical protein
VWQRIAAGASAGQELGGFRGQDVNYLSGSLRLRYTATHDSSCNANLAFSQQGGEMGAKVFSVVAMLMHGKAIIYSGQE